MKGKSVLVSIVLNALVMTVNWFHYRTYKTLWLAHRVYGGEITEEISPGWNAVHIYAMTPEGTTSHALHFAPLTLVISIAICAIILHLLFKCIGHFRSMQL